MADRHTPVKLSRVSIWFKLIEPPPRLEDGRDRYQARMLASMVLVLIPLVAISFVGLELSSSGRLNLLAPFLIFLWVAIGFLGLAYALSRTPYFGAGSILVVVVASTVVFAGILLNISRPDVTDFLFYQVIGVFLASVLFASTGTMALTAVNLVGALALALLVPDIKFNDIWVPMGFNLTVSAVILLAIYHRRLLEESRQRELSKALQDTERANLALQNSVEEARSATRLALEANQLKNEFVATMSHELRTPLNAIIGFTDIMLEGVGGQLDKDATHMTGRVKVNSERLLALIDDILDLSRIEANRLEVTRQPFSPKKLAEDLEVDMRKMAMDKGLDFEVRLAPGVPSRVIGDEDLTRRIGLNFLSNAFKFTTQGKVTLLIEPGSDDTWRLSVTDTGIGIPEHALQFIFDPFRQLDGTTRRAFGGTGLGLAIVEQLATLMGGSVEVKSVVDRGSTFAVTLPITFSKPMSATQA